MKTSGYNKYPKNHWRRWQWNRVVEHLRLIGLKPRESVVLYLAGKEDLDRKEAIRRGFSRHNLVAVETDLKAVAVLRHKGVNVINSPLHQTLNAWPDVNVVIADFCHGMHWKSVEFMASLASTPGIRVVSINMLRGRDPLTSDLQRHYGLPAQHRASVFVAGYAALSQDAPKCLQMMSPVYNQYYSGKNIFDSAVFLAAGGMNGFSIPNGVRNRVAAAKAIRTRRIEGKART